MVSKASELFPDPLSPVTTTNSPLGMATSMFLRLLARAPRTCMYSFFAIDHKDTKNLPNLVKKHKIS